MMFPVRAALISALPAFLSRRTANFSALQRRLPPLLGPAGRAALSTLPSSSPAPTATAAAAADSSSQKPAVAPPQAQITTTASSVTPETVRGRHVFKVSGYSLLKGLGVGKFVRSSTFAVGGYDWCVRYCPESDGCSDSGCIAVFLALMTKDVEVRALFDFRLVNPATGGLSRSIRMERPAMFNDAAGSLGYQMFQKRTVLEASEYLRGDCLVIQCDVTVIMGTPVPQSEAIQAVVPSDSDIQALPCEVADYVMITVKGEEFRVHRQLKDTCIGFITSSGRMDDVVATEGYKRLKVACPNVVEEIRKKAAEPSKNR
ncbi:BTB/POZ and MATH domain-containing protein 5-like [Setaria italica]|uniref:BTB/POZ and MATH domain-containing protein 5-like n=1 Tax=Setaria italica TaxID=4555 RepID=UPI000350A2C5|nr:BTB/POZ and MATH domain-containing protein 5-like [Setaria italica]